MWPCRVEKLEPKCLQREKDKNQADSMAELRKAQELEVTVIMEARVR